MKIPFLFQQGVKSYSKYCTTQSQIRKREETLLDLNRYSSISYFNIYCNTTISIQNGSHAGIKEDFKSSR